MKSFNDYVYEYFLQETSGVRGSHVEDLMKAYLLQEITSPKGLVVEDLWFEWFVEKGFSSGSMDERWYAFLVSEGYSGTLREMLYGYFKDKVEGE